MSSPAPHTTNRAPLSLIWTALGAVYVIWGTTYLAIRVVNRTMPPLLAAGVRFLIAGGVLYALAIRRGDREGDRPTLEHWRSAAIVGGLLLFGGNGMVVWAERTIPSGVTALIIALVPLWMALFDRLIFRHHLATRTVVGLVGGFGGAALLVGGSATAGHVDLTGMLFALGASICWASGSLFSRNAPLPSRPFVFVAMEMVCGGVLLTVVGIALGELRQTDVAGFSTASIVGLAYLITIGSWGGFASYVWLLRNARTSLVSTYAYVNPVVALFLGWLILNETITVRLLVAAAIVVVGVAIIISGNGAAHRGEPVEAEREPEEAVA